MDWVLSHKPLLFCRHRQYLFCTHPPYFRRSPRFCSWALLFSIYTSPFASLASSFSVQQQQYADDSQLYISLSPSSFSTQIHRLEDCLSSLHAWCCHNSLSLNPDKSDSVLFGTRQRSHSFSDVTAINVAGSVVPLADHVKLLGVTLDNRLSMDRHVNDVSRSCFYHLRALRHIRPAITASDANMIACSVVGSRLDYANAVLYGVSAKNINRLQRVQNAWLVASSIPKLIKVRTRCYNIYIGYLYNIASTSNSPSLRFWHVQPPLVRISTHQSRRINHLARFVHKNLASSLFRDQKQSLAPVRFASLLRLFLTHLPRKYDHVTMFYRFADNWRHFISAAPLTRTSDILPRLRFNDLLTLRA